MYDIDDAKRTATQGSKNCYSSHRPEDEFEVEVIRDVGTAVSFADGHGEDGVRDHPCDDHISADGAVIVFCCLGLGDAGFGHLEAVAEVAERFVVAGVDIELLRGHFELDSVTFAGDGGPEVNVDDVVALCAPCDVVSVAKGVDLEGADVGGEEGEVLGRGGKHVPGVKVEEGHEEVEADGGGGGDDEVGEEVVAKFEVCGWSFELQDYDVEGCEGGVGHYDGVDDYAGHKHPFGAVRRRKEVSGCKYDRMVDDSRSAYP